MTGKPLLRALIAYCGIALLVVLPVLAAPDAGQGQNTTIYAMNTSKTEQANLVVSFVSPDGNPAASAGAAMNPMARALVSAADEGVQSNWVGSAVLYSDQELASVAKITWTGGTANDGITQAAYTGTAEGSMEIFLPNLFVREWMYSTIAVQNVSTEETDFTISYYNRGETTPFVQISDPDVPADANRYYDLMYASRSTDPSKVPTFPENWLGAAIVTSDHDAAAVVTTHWNHYAGAYQGVAAEEADYQIYMPSIFKRKFSGNWYSFNGMLIQNTENVSATIRLKLYDRDGSLDADLADEIGPLSANGYNTRYRGDEVGEPFYDLGFNWLGSAVISSTTKVAVQVNTDWPGQSSGASYNGLAPSQGSTDVYLPHMAKIKSGGWVEFCGAIIQNLSDQFNTVDAYVYSADGGDPDWNDYYKHLQVTAEPWSAFSINTRYSPEFDSVPNNWQGTIYLSGEYNIGAIVNCQRNDSGFTYNGHAQ